MISIAEQHTVSSSVHHSDLDLYLFLLLCWPNLLNQSAGGKSVTEYFNKLVSGTRVAFLPLPKFAQLVLTFLEVIGF